jgi:hypothetical protein
MGKDFAVERRVYVYLSDGFFRRNENVAVQGIASLTIAAVNSHYHSQFSHGGITCGIAISRQF